VTAIARTLEMRDPYTAGHQQRVTALAVSIGRRMRLRDELLEGLYFGASIHDIGKISVPAEILTKPGTLSELEFMLIQQHVMSGFEIVKGIEFPWPVAEMIAQHHERLDGSGYPRGLKAEEIILEARIIAVADVFEVMSTHRPYRPALGMSAALEEIEKGKGNRYDPQVVEACIAVMHENDMRLPHL
jgi:putative nucleotidyltransferase with HDIG domain